MTVTDVNSPERAARKTEADSPSERVLEPGSVGWTADEVLLGPWAEAFEAGRYELIEGVIARTPPAKFAGSGPVSRLVPILDAAGEAAFGAGQYAWAELHLWITFNRTAIADGAEYVEDAVGEGEAELRPSLPFDLTIPLARLWPV